MILFPWTNAANIPIHGHLNVQESLVMICAKCSHVKDVCGVLHSMKILTQRYPFGINFLYLWNTCICLPTWITCLVHFTYRYCFDINFLYLWNMGLPVWCILTLVLLNQDIFCFCKQCRSRSVGFWRSQLIWICTVCYSVYEFVSTNWNKKCDWLKIRSGRGI